MFTIASRFCNYSFIGFINRNHARRKALFQLSGGQWSNTMMQSVDTKCFQHSFIRDNIQSQDSCFARFLFTDEPNE